MGFLEECHKTLEEKAEAWENKHMADTEGKDKEYKLLTADRGKRFKYIKWFTRKG